MSAEEANLKTLQSDTAVKWVTGQDSKGRQLQEWKALRQSKKRQGKLWVLF